MKVTLTIGEDNRVLIPQDVIEALHLLPGTKVQAELGEVTDAPPYKFEREKFDAAIEKYGGSLREKMLADGYASVDEMMEDIRPRW
jgi:antitoxin component of MazEF toxin-antitoxin module